MGFVEDCLELRKKSMQLIEVKNGNSDGVISPIDYGKYSGVKILWILKEPYGDGGCDQAEEKEIATCAKDIWMNKNDYGYRTFAPMILLAHLLSGGDPLVDVYTSEIAYRQFKYSTGYVNIKKIPGASYSRDNEIRAAAGNNKDFIESQINLYIPRVIIGGGTLKYFFIKENFTKRDSIFEQIKILNNHDCGFPSKLDGSDTISGLSDRIDVSLCLAKTIDDEDIGIYPGSNYLFIDAKHPSAIYGKMPSYCNLLKNIIEHHL